MSNGRFTQTFSAIRVYNQPNDVVEITQDESNRAQVDAVERLAASLVGSSPGSTLRLPPLPSIPGIPDFEVLNELNLGVLDEGIDQLNITGDLSGVLNSGLDQFPGGLEDAIGSAVDGVEGVINGAIPAVGDFAGATNDAINAASSGLSSVLENGTASLGDATTTAADRLPNTGVPGSGN